MWHSIHILHDFDKSNCQIRFLSPSAHFVDLDSPLCITYCHIELRLPFYLPNNLSQIDIDMSQAQSPLVDEEKPFTNYVITVVTQNLLLRNFLQDIPFLKKKKENKMC